MQRASPQVSAAAHSSTSASKAGQAGAVQVGLGQLQQPLGLEGENSPKTEEGGDQAEERRCLRRGRQRAVGQRPCGAHPTGHTAVVAQGPPSRAGLFNLLLKYRG